MKFRQNGKVKFGKLREVGIGIDIFEEMKAWLEDGNYGKLPRSYFIVNGQRLSALQTTDEQKKESSLSQKWNLSNLKKVLDDYAGQPIEEIPEEWREKILVLRSYGLLGKNKEEKIKDRMRKSVGKYVAENDNIRRELEIDIVNEKFR